MSKNKPLKVTQEHVDKLVEELNMLAMGFAGLHGYDPDTVQTELALACAHYAARHGVLRPKDIVDAELEAAVAGPGEPDAGSGSVNPAPSGPTKARRRG
jgi:hypothetical protein